MTQKRAQRLMLAVVAVMFLPNVAYLALVKGAAVSAGLVLGVALCVGVLAWIWFGQSREADEPAKPHPN